MFIYKAQLAHQPETAFLAELKLHIMVAERAYQTLYKLHLYESGDKLREYTTSPIEAMTDFALFVNSCALMSKVLGLCHNNVRGEKLRALKSISMDKIKALDRIDIRNSLEHMDERLDKLIASGVQTVRLWDMTKDTASNEITLRKFDPLAFTIACIDTDLTMATISISDCLEDILYLKNQVY